MVAFIVQEIVALDVAILVAVVIDELLAQDLFLTLGGFDLLTSRQRSLAAQGVSEMLPWV